MADVTHLVPRRTIILILRTERWGELHVYISRPPVEGDPLIWYVPQTHTAGVLLWRIQTVTTTHRGQAWTTDMEAIESALLWYGASLLLLARKVADG